MTLNDANLTYRKIDDMRVSSIIYHGTPGQAQELQPHLEKLLRVCGERACGPARLVYHFETAAGGKMDLEVCVPVTEPVETGDIRSRTLKGGEALSILHRGPLNALNESSQKVYAYLREHGIPPKEPVVVYRNFDANNPENNLTEIQAFIHPWCQLLQENLQRVLGEEAARTVMQDSEQVTVESSLDERVEWIKGAMARLDDRANDDQKYQVLSPCAHVFPQKHIDIAREVYERERDLDAVIDFMLNDHPVYSKTIVREGNTLYVTKQPADKEGYASAQTSAEKRMAACFCALIRQRLDAGVSPTFCNCSAGWFRQTWEGILGQPVQVEILETVLKGDEICRFAVHLPLE
jgi:effector-binding domain-containing protein